MAGFLRNLGVHFYLSDFKIKCIFQNWCINWCNPTYWFNGFYINVDVMLLALFTLISLLKIWHSAFGRQSNITTSLKSMDNRFFMYHFQFFNDYLSFSFNAFTTLLLSVISLVEKWLIFLQFMLSQLVSIQKIIKYTWYHHVYSLHQPWIYDFIPVIALSLAFDKHQFHFNGPWYF